MKKKLKKIMNLVSRAGGVCRNERGMALIVTLMFLVTLTVLGMLTLSTSDIETRISGNFRSRQQAFSASERAINFGKHIQEISKATGTVALTTGTYEDAGGVARSIRNAIRVGKSGLDTTAGSVNEATFLSYGNIPISIDGNEYDQGSVGAIFVNIHATGAYPLGAPNPSRYEIETVIWDVVPKQSGVYY